MLEGWPLLFEILVPPLPEPMDLLFVLLLSKNIELFNSPVCPWLLFTTFSSVADPGWIRYCYYSENVIFVSLNFIRTRGLGKLLANHMDSEDLGI